MYGVLCCDCKVLTPPQITGVIQIGLTEACEAQSPPILLEEVLDPGLSLMRQALQKGYFKRILVRLWDVLLCLTRTLVLKNAEVGWGGLGEVGWARWVGRGVLGEVGWVRWVG